MALLENRIGAFYFLGLSGERQPAKMVLSLDERPGVEGTEITREGLKGRPFRLRSWVDAVDYDTARLMYDFYRDLIADDPQELVQGGISSTLEGFLVQVLDVSVVFCGAGNAGTNGLNPPSNAYIECDWDLIAIPQ